ncbi:MAG: D-alanyl-D-alanine carboxypeptidase family protein [Actinomycetota bacterium]
MAAAGPLRAAGRAGPEVSCDACIVVADGDAVWSRNPAARLPNASTTKMVTALLTITRVGVEERIVVSTSAAATSGGGLELSAGDVYTVRELLLALLLSSSNDAAVALAEHVSGAEHRFVAQMNAYARYLGARSTHFVTPHGLDTPNHYSSARDLALIGDRLLGEPVLARMVARQRVTIGTGDGRETLENRNELLGSYRGAVGIKTGQTSGAGEVLVAAARREGHLVIAVAMRSDEATLDARALLDYGFAHLRRHPQSDVSPFANLWEQLLNALLRLLAAPFGVE